MTYKVENVQEGEKIVTWAVRKYTWEDGSVSYDWIADDARGNYDESDESFDSVHEAMEDLGVR